MCQALSTSLMPTSIGVIHLFFFICGLFGTVWNLSVGPAWTLKETCLSLSERNCLAFDSRLLVKRCAVQLYPFDAEGPSLLSPYVLSRFVGGRSKRVAPQCQRWRPFLCYEFYYEIDINLLGLFKYFHTSAELRRRPINGHQRPSKAIKDKGGHEKRRKGVKDRRQTAKLPSIIKQIPTLMRDMGAVDA